MIHLPLPDMGIILVGPPYLYDILGSSCSMIATLITSHMAHLIWHITQDKEMSPT